MASEKILIIFARLATQIEDYLLKETLKTRVMSILIKELNEQNDMKLKA